MKFGWKLWQLTILIGLIIIFHFQAYSQTGPNYSSSATNDGTGNVAFTNPANAAGSTSSNYATIGLDDGQLSDYLQFTGFGFSITDGHQIDGIKVEVKGFASHNNLRYTSVYLIRGGTIQTGGTNHGIVTMGITDGIKSLGSSFDLWGISLTEAQVEAANFGVAIQLSKINGTGAVRTGNIDWVRVTVYHSSASVQTFTSSTSGNWNLGTTWDQTACASGCVEGTDYPSGLDKVNIIGGHMITIPAGFAASCFKLILNSNLSNTVASTLTFGSSATSLTVNNFALLKASFAHTAAGINTINMNGGTINLNGDLYLEAHRTGGNNWQALINIGGGTMTVTGNIDLTSNNIATLAEIRLTTAGSKLIMTGALREFGTAARGQRLSLGTDCTVEYNGTNQDVLNQVGNTVLTYDKITLSGSSSKTALLDMTINGKLSLQGTTTLDLDGNSLTYGTSSSLEYKGAAAQTTGQEMNAVGNVQTLIIDNTNGVNLNASKSIDDAITFTNGKITLGANNLTLASGATTTGQSTTSYIVTNSTGYLERTAIGATVYPIGTSTYYDPVTITPAIDAAFRTTVGAGPNNSPSDPARTVQLEWQIATTGSPGATSLLFQWDRTNQEGADFQANDGTVVVGQYTTEWEETAAGYTEDSPTGRSSASASGYTSFGAFGVGADYVSLPIDLLYFDVALEDGFAKIHWATSSETNNDFFTIKKSIDGKTWQDFKTVSGAGNSNISQSYTVIDPSPFLGKSYYKLRQTDFDGNFEDFQMVTLQNQMGDYFTFDIYPNPIKQGQLLQLNFGQHDLSEVEINVRNLAGKVLFKQKFINRVIGQPLEFQLNEFIPKGLYLIEAITQHQIHTAKLIVKD